MRYSGVYSEFIACLRTVPQKGNFCDAKVMTINMKKNNKIPHKPHHTPEEMPTMMLMGDISKLFHDKLRNFSEQIGIPDGYRHILFTLARADGKTQYEISVITHLKAPTVSVALQKMEAEGLVTRFTDETDQRQSRVYITERGREIHKKMEDNLKVSEKLALDAVSEEEEAFLRRILLKMRSNLLDNNK